MFQYKVGELYNPNKREWSENPQFNFRSNSFELVLFYKNPTLGEIMAAQSGRSEFALVVEGDTIFILSKFGDKAIWSDSPYSYHLVPADQQTPLPALEDSEQGILLNVLLVDAGTGIIKALRLVSLSPHFSRKLVEAIANQMQQTFDANSYDKQLERLYQLYPESRLLLRRAVARSAGGQ